MMKTITLVIGNSDNKLTQVEWTRFCRDVEYEIKEKTKLIHFSAPSIGWLSYQNACFVFGMSEENLEEFKKAINEIRKVYQQDSVAFVCGDTEFI